MSLLNKYFPKKFKVRVKHHAGKYYVVQVSNTRLGSQWETLETWHSHSHPCNLDGWRLDLLQYKAAEKLAASFNTMMDVYKHKQSSIDASLEWYRLENEYMLKHAPYKVKTFKE